MKYRVHYTKENYNPYRSYMRNQNRLAGCKIFDDLSTAKEFAKTVKNATIYNTAGIKVF